MPNLPRGADFPELPKGTVIAIRVPSQGLELYRLVLNDPPQPADFEPMSDVVAGAAGMYELSRLGVSHFLTREDVEAVRKRPDSLVARVTLQPGRRVHIARTGTLQGHVDVWAPLQELFENAEIADRMTE